MNFQNTLKQYTPVSAHDLQVLDLNELHHLLNNYEDEVAQHGIADYEIERAISQKRERNGTLSGTEWYPNPALLERPTRHIKDEPTRHLKQTKTDETNPALLDDKISKSFGLLKDGKGTAVKERERHLNNPAPGPDLLGCHGELGLVSFRPSPSGLLAGNKKKGGYGARRPKAIEHRHIERLTNTARFNMFQIHLQLWANTAKGVAPVTGSIEYKKRNGDGSLDSRFQYCDFTPRKAFRRNLNSYKNFNKRHRFIEDPWWQELNRHLQWYDWQLNDLGLLPLLVSFSQHRIRGKKNQIVGFKRDDQTALMLLRNNDRTPSQLVMFNGPYALKFKDFRLQTDQATGHSDYRDDWYKKSPFK